MDTIPFCPVKPLRGGKPLDSLFNKLMADPQWMAQAKLDGRRAVWDGDGVLWSRQRNNLKDIAVSPVAALQGCTHVMDGEFIRTLGKDDGTFYPFDLPDHPGNLDERTAALKIIVGGINDPSVVLCPFEVLWPQVDVNGWEGIVLKKRSSFYPKARVDGKTTPAWVKYRAEWL